MEEHSITTSSIESFSSKITFNACTWKGKHTHERRERVHYKVEFEQRNR
jgi:hypothetical protein